jgi:YVTN family beta-propeller protein
VTNENSGDVSVIDLSTDAVIKTVASSALPAPGTLEAKVQIGKAIFDSSTGINLPHCRAPICPA